MAVGVGAVALIGGAVHEWDKHFGGNPQQHNNPPPQQPPHQHWWQNPQLPNFGPPLPQQQQNQSHHSQFPPFAAFSGGVGEITGPGACPSGPGKVHDLGQSWNYNVQFNVPVSTAAQQVDWRMCRKCLVMNWTGYGIGPCASGGRHDNHGSHNYRLDSGPNGQKNWRFCNKCYSLGFNGHNDLGKCPGGGVHEHGGSWDFGLLHDGEGGQDRWKWCLNCQQLVFDGWH
ncbi:hypothetical protein K432DRAFT_385790 [Lepidopterella palustris CBS 459.81]|uniref:Uncharacterized protein n=1 Tax=Lepidopterella palustris CBS 459.81 TaxID=1314670 RepID=A0A8E2E230_9PEZI|nr:hypothetical protein K432DRAFT_385790 [Lepidopterella palustris CBS 459.81]